MHTYETDEYGYYTKWSDTANHVSYSIVKWHLMQTKMTTLPDEATSASVIADAHALYCNSGRNDLNAAI